MKKHIILVLYVFLQGIQQEQAVNLTILAYTQIVNQRKQLRLIQKTIAASQGLRLESYLNRQSELDKLLGFGEDDEIEETDKEMIKGEECNGIAI